MTLLHLNHGDVRSIMREERFPLLQILTCIGAGFSWLHQAVVNAKLRRMQGELMFRHDYNDMFPPEQDVKTFPQRPLILGDKWDF